MRRLIASLLLSATLATAAPAATIEARDGVIYITGMIEVGDGGRFRMLESEPPKLVVLDSPGGEVDNALSIARLIHNIGIATLIPEGKECLSACAMLFLAGKPRYMGEGAALGVHNAWDDTGASVQGTAAMTSFLVDTAAAPLDMIFALSHTAPAEMWLLPRERWAELNITEWTAPLD